ncbi:hypothetical protein [Shewanella dokdonensis]|uniref:hypothetical protein n=1 Tax=Shewanella dokdonensis TaxID=712036 RepID=UPI001FD0633A|nr:hypothetical protein [Shewanella dokdonensis]
MDKGIPLKTRAEVKAFSGSRMLKVLGLDEFVSTGTCNDRYCLFLPTYDVSQRELLTLGWGPLSFKVVKLYQPTYKSLLSVNWNIPKSLRLEMLLFSPKIELIFYIAVEAHRICFLSQSNAITSA